MISVGGLARANVASLRGGERQRERESAAVGSAFRAEGSRRRPGVYAFLSLVHEIRGIVE